MFDQDPPVDHDSGPAVATVGPPTGATTSHDGLGEVDPWAAPVQTGSQTLNRGLRGLTEVLEVVALALIMFMGVRMVVHNYVVDGNSMVPTFENGQLIIVNRMAYRTFDLSWVPGVENDSWQPFGEPSRGDIIVFQHQRNPPRDFIKRVIGIPGDEVAVEGGLVYVNGQALDEPYIAAQAMGGHPAEVVPPGHVFVMGDNRNNSLDSRSFGVVSYDQIIGRAEVRYWPLGEVRVISHRIGSPIQNVEVISTWVMRSLTPR